MRESDSIRTCNILEVHIAAVDMERLVDFTVRHIHELSGDYFCVSNVHTTVTAFENEEYRAVQNQAVLALPDGGPLVTVSRARGYREMGELQGRLIIKEIFKD